MEPRTWEKYEEMPKDVMMVKGADGHLWERVLPISEHAWRCVYPDQMSSSTVSPYDHRMMPCTEILPEPELRPQSVIAADSAERRVDAVLRQPGYLGGGLSSPEALVPGNGYPQMLIDIVDAVRRADAGESPAHDELWSALRTSIDTASSLTAHLNAARDEVARLKYENDTLREKEGR